MEKEKEKELENRGRSIPFGISSQGANSKGGGRQAAHRTVVVTNDSLVALRCRFLVILMGYFLVKLNSWYFWLTARRYFPYLPAAGCCHKTESSSWNMCR